LSWKAFSNEKFSLDFTCHLKFSDWVATDLEIRKNREKSEKLKLIMEIEKSQGKI